MAKVSIHCDGTDIYIVPDEKKIKTQEPLQGAARKEKEEELQGLQSRDNIGHESTDNQQYDPLLPYEFNTEKKSDHGFSNSNGNGNGYGNGKGNSKGIILLEKTKREITDFPSR